MPQLRGQAQASVPIFLQIGSGSRLVGIGRQFTGADGAPRRRLDIAKGLRRSERRRVRDAWENGL